MLVDHSLQATLCISIKLGSLIIPSEVQVVLKHIALLNELTHVGLYLNLCVSLTLCVFVTYKCVYVCNFVLCLCVCVCVCVCVFASLSSCVCG